MGLFTKDYFKLYATGKVFVETGTYEGYTVNLAQNHGFDYIYSFEKDKDRADTAKRRFMDDSKVKIIHGNSGELLEETLSKHLNDDITFFLDAHNDNNSPLRKELETIRDKSKSRNHTIAIDDKRLFSGFGISEDEVLGILKEINANYQIVYIGEKPIGDIICSYLNKAGLA